MLPNTLHLREQRVLLAALQRLLNSSSGLTTMMPTRLPCIRSATCRVLARTVVVPARAGGSCSGRACIAGSVPAMVSSRCSCGWIKV